MFFQLLKESATCRKKLSQPLPLQRASLSPVIFLPSLLVMMLYGVLPLKIFAPVPSQLPFQLTPLLCLLAPLLSLSMIITACLEEPQSPPVVTPIHCQVVTVPVLTMSAFLLCPVVCPSTAHLAEPHPVHPTGTVNFHIINAVS